MLESRQDQFFRNEIKEITVLIILGIIMAIILPLVLGFGFRLFETSFVEGKPIAFGSFLGNYLIYFVLILAGLIGLPILKIRELYVTNSNEHPAEQTVAKHVALSTIHDPERQSLLYQLFESMGLKGKRNPMRWQLSIFRTFMIGIIIFGAVGLYQAVSQTALSGIPQIPFQFTKLGEVVFSVEPPAFAETFSMFFVMSLLLGELAWLVSKLKAGRWVYYTLALVIVCPAVAFLWMSFHNITYGNNEVALFVTFIFGLIIATTVVLFGTVFYGYIFHVANNLSVKLSQIATHNEDVYFIWAIVLGLITLSYLSFEIWRWKWKKKKKAYIPKTPD